MRETAFDIVGAQFTGLAMKIALITPAAGHARNGNRNTAYRWAAFLRELGHRSGRRVCMGARDLSIALHAREHTRPPYADRVSAARSSSR